MNTAIQTDISYFAQQSTDQIQWMISGMAVLMQDTEGKAATMQSQNWFQRMARTVTGKNKLTLEEIKRNHEKLNVYMAEVVAELYRINRIDQRMIMSLGTQLNEVYADHLYLKQALGAFVEKLNAKIASVDNFHMLVTEIEQGVYTTDLPLIGICKVLSQFDRRILEDTRKLDIIRRSLSEQKIINANPVLLQDHFTNILRVPMTEAGQIYLELGTIRENFIAALMMRLMEGYHFLPDVARKTRNWQSLIDSIIQAENLDADAALSTQELYDDFVCSKVEVENGLISVVSGEKDTAEGDDTPIEDCEDTDGVQDIGRLFALAEQGDADAQLTLGYFFDSGDGDDALQAEAWFRKAAEQRNAEAQCYLGLYLYHGDGTGQDLEQAAAWYWEAAEQGYAPAQHLFGECLFYGTGIEEDKTEAVGWFKIAAQQGYAPSQALLGKCYENGVGVQQNLCQAVEWYQKAAEQESNEGMYYLGLCYFNGTGVAADYVQAVELFQRAVDQGYVDAIAALAICYESGSGVGKDLNHAVALYRQAAEQGNLFGQMELGRCYMYGRGVLKNLQTAKEWLQRAVKTDCETGTGIGRAHYLYAQTLYAIHIRDCLEISKLDVAKMIPGVNFGAFAIEGVLKSDENKKLRAFLRTLEGKNMMYHYEIAAQHDDKLASEKLKKLKKYT